MRAILAPGRDQAKGHYGGASAKSLPRQIEYAEWLTHRKRSHAPLRTPPAGAGFVAIWRPPRPTNSRLLTAEKMWALKRLGDPAITPDGVTAVVPVTTYDIAENKGLTDLWLIPAGGRRRPPAHQRQGQRHAAHA